MFAQSLSTYYTTNRLMSIFLILVLTGASGLASISFGKYNYYSLVLDAIKS